MQNDKLLNCPFCNRQPRFRIYDLKGYKGNYEYIIRCDKCNIQFREDDVYTTPFIAKQEVVNKWNTRKPMENIVTELEERKEDIAGYIDDDIFLGEYRAYRSAIDLVKGGVDNG